ncbi:MAG TPA: sigma-70 family RNA polymerase sigma factor [Luteolibacter sp.]|nr:sigma-70 family RNA polymerase sigma factor [Luteolibacter sp.]
MPPDQRFLTTRWSILKRAASEDQAASAHALAEFCQNYRGPLLAYAAAFYPQDAEDLVHGFFERMIEQGVLASADPAKGKLRTFLLTCLKRHIFNPHRHQSAGKRGGGAEHMSIDGAADLADSAAGPEALYHRRWAQEVLERAIARLRDDWTRAGKAAQFEELHPFLGYSRDEDEERTAIAERLGISAGALKTAIYRIRKEYRDALLQEIADTLEVKTQAEVIAEMKDLMAWV